MKKLVLTIIAVLMTIACMAQQQKTLAKMRITHAENDGVDVTPAVLAGGGVTVLYNVDGQDYMSNFFENNDTQSWGPVYNLDYTNYPETTDEYYHSVATFSWSYQNSYDTHRGTCQCRLTLTHKPQGIVSNLVMITEDLETIEYTGYVVGSLNL